ncbi:unnamed protein product, partial [Ixodes hexagonus]
WKLIVKPKAVAVSDLTVIVVSKQRDPKKAAIRARSFVKNDGKSQEPLIYSRVTKGTDLVLDAKVTATISFNGSNETFTLPLLDNGKGPDPKKNDGEYSAYMTKLQGSGRYSVRTDVKILKTTRLQEQSMVAYAGTLNVKNNITREDLEPARIRDLAVSDAKPSHGGLTATLSWTAMG